MFKALMALALALAVALTLAGSRADRVRSGLILRPTSITTCMR
jgi:hypothetical protein